MRKIYIVMRFYDNGGLTYYEIINCLEEELDEKLAEFEKECVTSNLGERIGFLQLEEFNYITNDYVRRLCEKKI